MSRPTPGDLYADRFRVAWDAMNGLGVTPVNTLPAPTNQTYANLYALIENFIWEARHGDLDELRAVMTSDIDQLIANLS